MNHRPFLLVLLACMVTICCLSGCGRSISSQVNVNFNNSLDFSKKLLKEAVLPFNDAAGETQEIWGSYDYVAPNNGEAVANMIAEVLITVPTYEIIERSELKSILGEQGLSAAEFMETKGVQKLEQLLKADMIVVGNVDRYNQMIGFVNAIDMAFTARCIDVHTGVVICSVSPNVTDHGFIAERTMRVCQEIAKQIKKKFATTSP